MLSITLFRNSWFPGCSAFLFLSLHSSGKSWLDLPDTVLYYSTSLWVWKEVVLGFRTLLTGFGRGLWGYVSRTGTWISTPNLPKNFLPFLKNAELSANEARFWPISRKKACCGDVKQELARNYFCFLFCSIKYFFITFFSSCSLHVKRIFTNHFAKITVPAVSFSLYLKTAYQTLLLPAHLQDSLPVWHTLR